MLQNKIIPTAALHTYTQQYYQILREYAEENINLLRISVTRYTVDRYIKDLLIIKKIYMEITGKRLELMLDIPYPTTKPRIFFNGQEDMRRLKKGDEIEIVKCREKLTDENYYFDCPELFSEFVDNKESYLNINDGKVKCILERSNTDRLIFKVVKEGVIGYGKAIFTTNKYYNPNWNIYEELLEKVSPTYLVLSETDNMDCLQKISEYTQKKNIKKLLRVESYEVISKLQDIIHLVDGIVIVRSKLALEDEGFLLGVWQEKIINLCKKLDKEVFLETDILETSCKGEPSSLEFIDIFNSIKMNVSGIISSGFIGMGNNLTFFCEVINKLIDTKDR